MNCFCRILGFYRAPPVVGRHINLEEEIEPIGEKRLLDTFFKKGKTAIKVFTLSSSFPNDWKFELSATLVLVWLILKAIFINHCKGTLFKSVEQNSKYNITEFIRTWFKKISAFFSATTPKAWFYHSLDTTPKKNEKEKEEREEKKKNWHTWSYYIVYFGDSFWTRKTQKASTRSKCFNLLRPCFYKSS